MPFNPYGLNRDRNPYERRKRYARKPGVKMSYDRAQTDRYKSKAERILKAQDILQSWDRLVEEVPVNPQRTLYNIKSDRSPYGFWTVPVDEGEEPPFPEPFPSPPPEEPPSGGGGSLNPDTVYVGHGYQKPGLPPGMKAAASSTTWGAIRFPDIQSESYLGAPLASEAIAINTIRILTKTSVLGLSLDQLDDQGTPYLRAFGRLYNWDGTGTGPIIFYRAYNLPEPPIQIAAQEFPYEYRPPYYSDDLLLDQSFGGNFAAIPVWADPANYPPSNPSPSDPSDPTPSPEAPSPSDPPRASYECNCPDYQRIELQDNRSDFPSRWRDREWRDSAAGSDGDCKHILAVKLKRGDPI